MLVNYIITEFNNYYYFCLPVAFVYSSGMSAVTTMMQAVLKSGDHIVCVNDVYGGVNRFYKKVASNFDITNTLVDATNLKNVEQAIQDNTKVSEGIDILNSCENLDNYDMPGLQGRALNNS